MCYNVAVTQLVGCSAGVLKRIYFFTEMPLNQEMRQMEKNKNNSSNNNSSNSLVFSRWWQVKTCKNLSDQIDQTVKLCFT